MMENRVNNCKNVSDLIEEGNQRCSGLWDVVVDVIEYFNMPHVEYHETPSKSCLENMDQQIDASKENSAQILTWDNNSTHDFITTPKECLRSISIFF